MGLFMDLGAVEATSSAMSSAASGFARAGASTCASTPAAGRPPPDLLATLDARELTALFRKYGEEPFAGRISRAIVETRASTPIETAEQLAALVERSVPGKARGRRIHPATRVFQALRIAVNDELVHWRQASRASLVLLRPGGRLVVPELPLSGGPHRQAFHRDRQRGCICPPEVPICVCGRQPRLRSLGRFAHTPVPPKSSSNRAPAVRVSGARASGRMSAELESGSRMRQAPSIQPPP